MKGQSHSDQKPESLKFLKKLVEGKRTDSGNNTSTSTTGFWGGRKEVGAWMKKCHFSHVLCPLLGTIKKQELCFPQTFWLEVSSEDTGKLTEHLLALHMSSS